MYTGAALSFGLIRACRSGLVLYCSVLSDAGGENDGSSAIFERSLLHVNGRELFRWLIMSFTLIVMCIYFGSRNLIPGASFTDTD